MTKARAKHDIHSSSNDGQQMNEINMACSNKTFDITSPQPMSFVGKTSDAAAAQHVFHSPKMANAEHLN